MTSAAPAHEPLLERKEELAIVDSALDDACGGEGRVLVIEGPAGIGKTTLLNEVADRATRRGFVVHEGHGDELASSMPFGVARQLFGTALNLPTGMTAREPDGGATLARNLYWLVQEWADAQPRMVCLDDAQWADADSLRALAFVLRHLDGLPVAVALATRGDPPAGVAELLALCRETPGARHLQLAPLAADSVAVLVRRHVGTGVGDDLVAGLMSATGGNPFLVHEVLVAMATKGWSGLQADPSQVAGLAPETVGRFVLRRLAAAGDASQRLARAVAVLGEAPLHVAADLAELDEGQGVAAADRLAASEILQSGLITRFVHPILREAVRADIPTAHRALMHVRAARLLADMGGSSEEVAVHLLEALPRHDPWAVDILVDAARQARDQGSPEIAALLFARALGEPPSASLRSEIAAELGATQVSLGRRDGIDTLQSAVDWAANDEQRIRAQLALARAFFMFLDTPRAVAMMDVLAEDPAVNSDLRLRLEGEVLGAARRHRESRQVVLARLDALHDEAKSPHPANVGILANLTLSAVEQNAGPDAVTELAGRALTGGWLFRQQSNQVAYVINALTWVDRMDEAVRVADDVLDWAREAGSLTMSTMAYATRSRANLRRGNVLDAEADARIAHAVAQEHGWGNVMPFTASQLANALIERAETAEAAAVLASLDPKPDHEVVPDYSYSQGLLLLSERRPDKALEHFLASGRRLEARGGVDAPGILPWRSSAAAAVLAMGDLGKARSLAEEELRLASASGVPGSIGVSQMVLGLVHGDDSGVSLLEEAVAVLEHSQRFLGHVRALIELGAMIRRHGRQAPARPPLRLALDLAHGHGAIALAERARAELQAAGARPRRQAIRGADALTASERRVADLVCLGLSNRQIARQLYISMRTVATHLTHIYQKLEITGRDEIATALGR